MSWCARACNAMVCNNMCCQCHDVQEPAMLWCAITFDANAMAITASSGNALVVNHGIAMAGCDSHGICDANVMVCKSLQCHVVQ